MIAFAYYLLKVIICSGILYGYYLLMLRNKVFHYWNRFYLLCTVLLSVTLPLVKINIAAADEASSITAIPLVRAINTGDAYVESIYTPQTSHFELKDLVPMGYCIISMGLLLVFLFTLWRIRNIVNRYEIIPMDGMSFLNTCEKGTPFSFLKYIFWNREIPADSLSGKQILLHEIAHVRQKHSYDKIFMQCVLIVFWSNPFFWLIRKEIGMIHEFIADREAVKDQDTAAFAAMILQAAFPKQSFQVGSYFFHSPIKRRLKMLINSNKPARSYFNRVMVLPILFIVVAGFTLKTNAKRESPLNKSYTVVIDAGHGGEDAGAKFETLQEKDLNLEIVKRIKELNNDQQINIVLTREEDISQNGKEKVSRALKSHTDLFVSVHINASPRESQKGFQIYISKSATGALQQKNQALASAIRNETRHLTDNPADILTRNEKGVYVLEAPEINYPSALVECGFITNAKDRVFLQSSENIDKIAAGLLSAMKKFLVSQENSVYNFTDPQKDASAFADPREKQKNDLSAISDDTIKVSADTIIIHRPVTGQDGITRKATPVAFYAKDLVIVENDTLPKGVKSIDVTESGDVIVIFNNGKAERMSVEEAHKKGYVPPAVLDKKSNNIQINPTTRIRYASAQPLIVVNGIALKKGTDIRDLELLLKPDDIESIQVIKNGGEAEKYGEEGRDGVVLITTKNKPDSAEYIKLLNGNANIVSVDETNRIFVKVEKEPSFPGGESALNHYLFEQLNSKDEKTRRTFAGSVKLRFIVNNSGGISDVKTISGDNELAEAVSRLIQSGPKWLPAVQNGKNVSAYHNFEFSYPPMVEKK